MSRFTDWYERTGKSKLSEARKARYKSDPEYRSQAQQASRQYKHGRRDVQPVEYSIEFSDAAKTLEVSTATLRAWRRKRWYPAPLVYGRRRYFTEHQVELLKEIAGHLKHSDLSDEKVRFALEIKVQLLYLNWD